MMNEVCQGFRIYILTFDNLSHAGKDCHKVHPQLRNLKIVLLELGRNFFSCIIELSLDCHQMKKDILIERRIKYN